jgi:hypothetical protein
MNKTIRFKKLFLERLMSCDINGHENMGHAHRSSYVPNVAKVEVGSVLYLEVEADNNRDLGE